MLGFKSTVVKSLASWGLRCFQMSCVALSSWRATGISGLFPRTLSYKKKQLGKRQVSLFKDVKRQTSEEAVGRQGETGKLARRQEISEIQGSCRNGRHILLATNSKAAITAEPVRTRTCSSASASHISLQRN